MTSRTASTVWVALLFQASAAAAAASYLTETRFGMENKTQTQVGVANVVASRNISLCIDFAALATTTTAARGERTCPILHRVLQP